jgi:hypothetical protein
VLSRWVPYQVYRLSARWLNARPELVRLISFVLLSLMIVCSLGLSILLTWSALALLLWNIFRARRDIYAVYDSARLDRSSRHATTQQNPMQRHTRERAGGLIPSRRADRLQRGNSGGPSII